MKFFRILFILLVAAFVVAQFFGIDKTNPDPNTEFDLIVSENPPPEIAQILRSACYDCHSNETVYPWYSNVAPFSWLLQDHVEEGRDHINFSYWDEFDQEDKAMAIEEIIEEIEDGEMPLPAYVPLHAEADLSDAQKEALFAWLRSIQKF